MPVPEDIYQRDVDFTALALKYPEFAKKLKSNRQLDFSDPESVRQLTKALLHRDFDLKIELPEDRLCPPVPNRFNYILFAQNLLDSTQDNYNDKYDPNRRVIGLDIGTGASAIYPLLACRQRPSWLFLATEIDTKSRAYAEQNIKLNSLESKIKILDTDESGKTLIPTSQLERFPQIDILLTNPPFYTSPTELQTLSSIKSRPPNSACTGSETEMIYPPGGETAFVTTLILESKSLTINKNNSPKIKWYTATLGKLSSLTTILTALKEAGCTNYAATQFVQGRQTRRWAVGWSWTGYRPALAVVRGTDAVDKRFLAMGTEVEILIPGAAGSSVDEVCTRINDAMEGLQDEDGVEGFQWRWKGDLKIGVGRSVLGDVWSRKARRRRMVKGGSDSVMNDAEPETEPESEEEDEEKEPKFVFKITCSTPTSSQSNLTSDAAASSTLITIRWLQGHDAGIFESFCGWVRRRIVT